MARQQQSEKVARRPYGVRYHSEHVLQDEQRGCPGPHRLPIVQLVCFMKPLQVRGVEFSDDRIAELREQIGHPQRDLVSRLKDVVGQRVPGGSCRLHDHDKPALAPLVRCPPMTSFEGIAEGYRVLASEYLKTHIGNGCQQILITQEAVRIAHQHKSMCRQTEEAQDGLAPIRHHNRLQRSYLTNPTTRGSVRLSASLLCPPPGQPMPALLGGCRL